MFYECCMNDRFDNSSVSGELEKRVARMLGLGVGGESVGTTKH